MASQVSTDKIASRSSGVAFTLPTADGTSGQAIVTNASGVLSFADAGPSLTGSTNTWIPTITGANAMAGTANFTYDGNTLDIKNGGTASSVKLYCESSNAHYQEIKAAPHAGSSNWTLTLPGNNGDADQFLQTDGAGVTSWAAGASGLQSVQTFTASGTWTKPSGITKVWIRVCGAGGGGGGAIGTEKGGGGGSGGYSEKFIDVSSVSTSTITIGSGGAGGVGVPSGTGNAGVTGGASSWADGTITVTGSGGVGGLALVSIPTGGAGGAASGGDTNIGGQPGLFGYGYLTHGGDSPLGKGGRAQMYENPAVQDATGYGGGGAGNVNAAFNVLYDDGTAGTGGIIIVHEYK